MNRYIIINLCFLLLTKCPPCWPCAPPRDPVAGSWFCVPSRGRCYLECSPGYVSSGRTSVTCVAESWTPDPASVTCTEPVALITGGLVGGDQALASVEIYGEGVSGSLPDLPAPHFDHSLDNLDGSVIQCGTMDTSSRSCFRMTEDFLWENHSSTWNWREEHASVVVQDRLFLIGGSRSAGTTEFLEDSPDNVDWTVGEELDIDREQSCVVKISPDTFVMIGGYTAMDKVVSWNVTSGERERLADTLEVRVDHACALLEDPGTGLHGILVAGGSITSNNGSVVSGLQSCEFYSFHTKSWRKVGNLNEKRSDLGQRMLVLKSGVFVFGGSTFDVEVERQVEMFDFKTETWTYAQPMIWPRRDYALTVVPRSWFL